MSKLIDLAGREFGWLSACYVSGRDKQGQLMWHCHCKCGGERNVRGQSLRNGHTQSCGCLILPRWRTAATNTERDQLNKMPTFRRSLMALVWGVV